MIMNKFLEAGRLTSARGLQGEMRFECWCDSPSFLVGIQALYLDNEGKKKLKINVYRPSIPSVSFEGYETRESVAFLAGKTVYFDKDDITLPEGTYFNADLIGLDVFDIETSDKIGVLVEIIENAVSRLYRIEGEGKVYLVPNRPEFVKSISLEEGIKVKLIEGLDDLIK